MAYFLVALASLLAACANLCFRRGIDAGGSSRPYIVVQLFVAAGLSIMVNPVRSGQYGWDPSSLYLGIIGGACLGIMMYALGRALEWGPPGLTFAVLNASSVMPAILMAMFFGSAFGHSYELWHGLGSAFVLIGLFWAGCSTTQVKEKFAWGISASIAFLSYALMLTLLQWRALMLDSNYSSVWLPFTIESTRGYWFLPILMTTAACIHFAILVARHRRIGKVEAIYGFLGGLFNGTFTYLLVLASEIATPMQQAMLWPLFAVGAIVLTNLWGQWLYREKIKWLAMALCLFGILIGTIHWVPILRAIF